VLCYALVLAFVNALETLTCGLTLEARLQRRFDANRALIASAIGSLASVCVGGFPVAGSAAASVANVDAGARFRRSALLAAAAVALPTVAGHGALSAIPLAALAGVTLIVAWAMALQPLRELLLQCHAARAGGHALRGDLAVAALVALLLLAAGSAVALLCGVLAASILALLQMRRGVVQRQYDALHAGATDIDAAAARQIRIVEIGQPLLFANVEPVVQAIEAQASGVRCVVIDLTRASAVDASAARALADCRLAMSGSGQTLLIVRPASEAAGAVAFDACPVFDRVGDAIRHALEALQAAPVAAMDPPPAPTTETECERATRLLLPHVGPIASVLAKRAERQSTSLDDFYRLLAEQLPSTQAGAAFLDAAGRPPTPTRGDAG
jgi:MFS superfamily sulfate permease-like transporter